MVNTDGLVPQSPPRLLVNTYPRADSGYFSPSRVTSPIRCLGVLFGKTLGDSAKNLFGSEFCEAIDGTSTTEALVGLVPVVGRVVLDLWGDAKREDLDVILQLIEECRQEGGDRLFRYQLEAAGLGHVDSMVEVGKAYRLKQDSLSARQWFAKAVVYHHPLAYLNLYMMCKESEPEYAEKLLASSQELGHLEKILALSSEGKPYEERFELTLFAAFLGDVDSMVVIAKTYAVQKDMINAKKWMEKAASFNNSSAFFELYLLTYKEDPEAAFYALNRAAEANHRFAIFKLIQIYEETGFGPVKPNPLLAEKWKKKSDVPFPRQYEHLSQSSLILPTLSSSD